MFLQSYSSLSQLSCNWKYKKSGYMSKIKTCTTHGFNGRGVSQPIVPHVNFMWREQLHDFHMKYTSHEFYMKFFRMNFTWFFCVQDITKSYLHIYVNMKITSCEFRMKRSHVKFMWVLFSHEFHMEFMRGRITCEQALESIKS